MAMFEVDGKKGRVHAEPVLHSKAVSRTQTLCHSPVLVLYFGEASAGADGGILSKESVRAEFQFACICTLVPPEEGFGKFLISMSYEQVILEGKTGSPRNPYPTWATL